MTELRMGGDVIPKEDVELPGGVLAPGATTAKYVSQITGKSQSAVKGELKAARQDVIKEMMKNPTKFAKVQSPADIASATVDKVIGTAEQNIPSDKKLSTQSSSEADIWSPLFKGDAGDAGMDDFYDVADTANKISEQSPSDSSIDAGSINDDSDMTNTSMDTINSISDGSTDNADTAQNSEFGNEQVGTSDESSESTEYTEEPQDNGEF